MQLVPKSCVLAECTPDALNPMSDLTLCLLEKLFMLCRLLIFFKINFFENFCCVCV